MEEQPAEANNRNVNMMSMWTDTSTRFPTWIALTVLSIVSFGSMLHQRHKWTQPWAWAFTVSTVSMLCGLVAYCGYICMRGVFMGQMPETALAGFLMLLWVVGLPVIMNPGNKIAVGTMNILDANIYFSSWGIFLCCVFLCGSIARESYGVDLLGRVGPIARTRMGRWYILVLSSLIVMIASVESYLAETCGSPEAGKTKCYQTSIGIALGVIGTVISGIFTIRTAKFGSFPLEYEWVGAFAMITIWSFGLYYITTGVGPGASVGNLYFATWASFILSILIFADCHKESLVNRDQAASNIENNDLSLEEGQGDTTVEVTENLEDGL